MSENDNDLQTQDLEQQLAEVNHQLDNLSPNMEPGDYLRRSEILEKKKKELEKVMKQKHSGEELSVEYTPDVDVDPFFKDYDVALELKTKDPTKKKKAFKMLSAFSILFIIIAALVVLSWILHWSGVTTTWKESITKTVTNGGVTTTTTTTEDHSGLIQALGVVDIFYSVFEGFKSKLDIIVFLLVIGAFITVVMSSKSLDAFAQSMTRKMKGKEVYALIPLMIFFSVCGTVEGFSEETLGFYLFLIPIMIMCGFDVFTGVLAILLGAGVGVLTSTVNPFVVSVAVDSLNQGIGNNAVQMGDGIAWRLITWFVFTAIAIAITMWYAMRVKKNPSKSITFSTYEGDKTFFLGTNVEDVKMNWKRKLTLVVFLVAFVLMIVYLINWDQLIYGTQAGAKSPMEDAGKAVNDKAPYVTHLIPGFGKGGLMVPGCFFLISAIVCGIINGVGEKGFIKTFVEGAADMLSVCLIIAVAGGVTYVLQQSHEQDLFVSGLTHLNAIPGIGRIIVMYLIFIPLSFLIPSSTGFATAIFPLLAGVVTDTNGHVDMLAATGTIQAFSLGAGVVMLFSPTNGVVMGAIGLSRMDYKTFLKGMMPIVGIFFVLGIAFLAIGGAIAGHTTVAALGGSL